MNKIFLLLVILVSSTLSYAQQKGFVYDDINENGIFDKKEPHISNVIVTDGFDVVKTDKKGMFTLPDNPKAFASEYVRNGHSKDANPAFLG